MATKKKPNKAKPTDPLAPAMAVGEQLLRAFKNELAGIKNPGNTKQNVWQILSEIQQDEILDRHKKVIEHYFKMAFDAILAGGVPAVHAELAAVTFGSKGIRGTLEISKASGHRHELADFSGKQVLVILTEELDDYLVSMDSVKPDKDQADLPLGDKPTLAEAVEKDPRTVEELTTVAVKLAEQLGEDDIDWSEKGREALIDYIGWAETAIAKKGKEKGDGRTIN